MSPRLCAVGVFALLGQAGWSAVESEPPLPVWDADERKELEAEGWVPGGILLTGDPLPELQSDVPEMEVLEFDPPTAEEMVEDEAPLTEVAGQHLDAYFAERAGSFLIDPQGLLDTEETGNRLKFLKDHAADSSIDLFVYVFGGNQVIPAEVRAEELIERFYAEGRPAAVVYYYLGAPQRSVLYLSPSLTDTVSAAEQRRALQSSVMQAFSSADPAGQLEAFSVQMSIRLYWMERMMAAQSEVAAASGPAVEEKAEEAEAAPGKLELMWVGFQPVLPLVAGGLGLVVMIAGLGFWFSRRARHRFPEIEVEPRLGGDHAAGIGAVISFASPSLPPASQRDQVPDYLRRA